jgi:nucleoid-associated protein YgaU
MAEQEIHPASWLGDAVEEFKRMPTWGKVGVGVVVIGVAGFAYIQYRNAQNANANTSMAASSGTAGTGSGTDLSTLLGSMSNPSLPPTTSTTPSVPTTGATTPTTTPSAPTTGATTPTTGPFMTGQPIIGPTKVTTPAPTPIKAPTAPKLQTYTVQPGDTLSGIASKLKIAGGWQTLYNANKAVVDRTAQAHGFYQNDQNWIFPGEKLTIPG